MQENIPHEALARITKAELINYYGMTLDIDYGNHFFNALFFGTLKTFVERVDSSGFCQTSYGELNGIKAYGHTHYPRDSAEAAIALANCGFVDIAEAIISFTLNNTPDGQYYIPHVFFRDGSIKANTIQVDTPGHVARALARCIELKGASEKLKSMFDKLDFIFIETWKHHFHKELKLLDGGNFNEQGFGGSDKLLADMFTNTSFMNGAEKMCDISRILGLKKKTALYEELASTLRKGIEDVLFNKERCIYSIAYDIGENKILKDIKWLSLYPQRWYTGKDIAWDRAFKQLEKSTTIDWNGMKIISCESPDMQFRILGKVFAHLIAYMGASGHFSKLEEHLDFAQKTIRHPSHIFPEWWYHHTPENISEYWEGYWKKFDGIWDSYESNPEADYTIDSGNCEQSAVFLNHQLQDLIGVSPMGNNKISLSPGLPFSFNSYSASGVPIRQKDGKLQELNFELKRDTKEVACQVCTTQHAEIECLLAIPAEHNVKEIKVNNKIIKNYSVKIINETKRVNIDLTGKNNNIILKY